MKPATHSKGHFSNGMRQTTASTPTSHHGQSMPTLKLPDQPSNSMETLSRRLKEGQQTLACERSKGLELRDEIEAKRRRIAEMENLHVGNQKLIEKYEKEITSHKPNRTVADLNARIANLEGVAAAACERLDESLTSQFHMLAQLTTDDLPEKHSNKVVELSVSQLRLYLSQVKQKDEAFRMKIEGMQRRRLAVLEETAGLKEDIKDAKAARLEDMKKLQKLARLELHSTEVIRSNHVKPVDEIAIEATREVFVNLKKKMKPEDDDCNFLQNLSEKLRARGVNVDF